MTKTISLAKAQSQLRELASLAEAGVEIVLTEADRPIARLLPVTSRSPGRRIPGLHPGALQASEDFDAPLPDGYWLGDP